MPKSDKLFSTWVIPFILVALPLQAVQLERVWSRQVDPRGRDGTAEFAEFSWDGQRILSGNGQGKAEVMKSSDGSSVKSFTFIPNFSGNKGGEVECGAFTPDGKLLALGGNQKPMKVFEYSSGKVVKEVSSFETDGLAFSPDGKYLAVAISKAVWLIRVSDWAELAKIDMGCGVNSCDFTADSKTFIAGSCAKKFIVVSVPDGKVLRTVSTPGSIKSARISPDGKWVATANADANVAMVYEFSTGKQVARLVHQSSVTKGYAADDPNNLGAPHYVEAVAWTRDSRHLFSSGPLDGQVNAWSASSWQKVSSIKAADGSHPVEYLDVSPDGSSLITAGEDGRVHLFRIRGAGTTGLLSVGPDRHRALAPAVSNTGIDALGRLRPLGKRNGIGNGIWNPAPAREHLH